MFGKLSIVPAMKQSSFIAGTLILGFIIYVTLRGQLHRYIEAFRGVIPEGHDGASSGNGVSSSTGKDTSDSDKIPPVNTSFEGVEDFNPYGNVSDIEKQIDDIINGSKGYDGHPYNLTPKEKQKVDGLYEQIDTINDFWIKLGKVEVE